MGAILNHYRTMFSNIDCWKYTAAFILGFAILMNPVGVMAFDLGEGLCNAVGLVTGSAGKAIATAAIITIAIGALLGRVSWGMAVMIAAGIAAIFGAPTIAATIAGGDAGSFCGGTQ